MSEKIIGYLLIFAGLGFILGSGLNIYQITTRQADPVRLFEFSGISLSANELIAEPVLPEDLEGVTSEQEAILEALLKQEEAPNDIGKNTEIEILPSEVLNETSNLFAHIVLMGFLATIGSRLSSVGVMMVRPIKVKLKTTNPDLEAK